MKSLSPATAVRRLRRLLSGQSRHIFRLALILCTTAVICGQDGLAYGSRGGKVVEILAGDLVIIINSSGVARKVTLYGIDAPDLGQEYGNKAKRFLEILVQDKCVIYDLHESDTSRGIERAELYLNNISINGAMVKAGYAWVDEPNCTLENCGEWQRFQSSAKGIRRGLWQQGQPQAPWQWREERTAAAIVQARWDLAGDDLAAQKYISGRGGRVRVPVGTDAQRERLAVGKSRYRYS